MKRGLVFLSALCVLVALVKTVLALAETGQLCSRETICAKDTVSLLLLAAARVTAYLMYPCLVLAFLSKSHALELWLSQTIVSVWLPVHDLHSLHVMCGHTIHISMWLHTITHLARWMINRELHFLVSHVSGLTGLVAFSCCVIIVFPMGYEAIRKRQSFEMRKTAHSVFGMLFGISLMFHAPKEKIGLVMGAAVFTFVIDWLFMQFHRTYKVQSSLFQRLEDGVQLTFKNPRGFNTDVGGYVLLMVPWICKNEWHAFSVFPHPTQADHSCVVIAQVGEWTRTLRTEVERETRRPTWIQGPFMSPFSTSVEYDNLLLVATGIGITPCIGLINKMKEDRRINLIWMCRDASLVEFILNSVEFDDDAVSLIYYTGKRKLNILKELPETVYVFNQRPNLRNAITNIVDAVENGLFSDDMEEESKKVVEASRKYAKLLATANEADLSTRVKLVIAHALSGYSVEEFMTDITMQAQHIVTRTPHHGQPDAALQQGWNRNEFYRLFSRLAPQVVFSDTEFDKVFEMFDEDGSGMIDLAEFETYCHQVIKANTLVQSTSIVSCSSRTATCEFNDEVGRSPSTLKSQTSLTKTWQTLYCGGSAPVIKDLTAISHQLGISFRVEKFDW
jgi:predicted ferric reductase